MYLPITQWPDQNSILFMCRHNRRSNDVAPPSLSWHTLNLTLLLTLILLLIGFLPYFLCLLTMPLFLTTLLLLTTISKFLVHTP
jgi:hypothetical protein